MKIARSIPTMLPILLLLGGASCGDLRPPEPSPQAVQARLRERSGACPLEGRWFVPRSGDLLSTVEILDRIGGARVVLLGESHDRPDDHRWQLQTIAALDGRHRELVLGFEMLPRSSQTALDAWSNGGLGIDEFLAASRWHDVWGYPADLYLPIFQFGRMNRVTMVALNIDYELIRRVSSEGWGAIPQSERAGLSDPAPPSTEYRAMLESVFTSHLADDAKPEPGERERFIESQLLWDRAFAEGIRDALQTNPNAVVVALVGSGHLENGYGVPHQLDALGIDTHVTLMPWDVTAECTDLPPMLADAVFGVGAAAPATARPRLGVFLEPAEGGVLVRRVLEDSVAEDAGIQPQDLIVGAAGRPIESAGELKAVVGKQPLGTTLPVTVLRSGRRMELDARFPVER